MDEQPQPNQEADAVETASEPKQGGEGHTMAIIGYILPFLFFLPLLDEKTKNDPFVRFHANQQLLILIVYLGLHFLSGFFMTILFAMWHFVWMIINLALLALIIIGAMNAHKKLMKELPVIGHFRVLK